MVSPKGPSAPSPGMAPPRRRQDIALAALILGAVAMGVSPLFVRWADVGPFTSAFWRVALALPLLYAWAVAERRTSAAQGAVKGAVKDAAKTDAPARWLSTPILLVGFFFAGDLFFWHLAIFNTSVANATFFATMAPLFVVIANFVLFRTPIERHIVMGLALCIAGGAFLVGTSMRVAPDRLIGDAYGLITAMFFAAYIIAVGRARGAHGTGEIAFKGGCVTAALLLLPALAFESTLLPQSGAGLAALFALALLSHLGGQGLLTYALGHLPSNFSALVIFLEGVAAAIAAWIFLAEALTATQTIGALLIFAGVFAARRRAGRT